MNSISATSAVDTVDLRLVAPPDRRPLVVARVDELPPGAHFMLVDDHDPRPFFDVLQEHAPGRCSWNPLQTGPDVWTVRVGRVPRGSGHCCGGCCGA